MNLVLNLGGSIYTEYNVGYLSVNNNDPTQMLIVFMKSANHGYVSYTIQINLTTNPKSYSYCYSGGDRFAFGYSTSGNFRAVIQQANTNKLYVWAQEPLLSGSAIVDGVTATTQASGDNSTKLATTEYVDGGLSGKSGATNWLNGSATGSVRTSGSKTEDANYTIGQYATAEGNGSAAFGNRSHAEGNGSYSEGFASHAEGSITTASGYYSHSEGYVTKAIGDNSHSEGAYTKARGNASHVGGLNTLASGASQTVIGQYNIEDETAYTSAAGTTFSASTTYYTKDGDVFSEVASPVEADLANYYTYDGSDAEKAFIIGNGTANDARSNAFSVDWDGNVETNNVLLELDNVADADLIQNVNQLGWTTEQNQLFDAIYPVGTCYETYDTNIDPNTAFYGVWSNDDYKETKKLLWTNGSPTSRFAAQTINISNINQYDFIDVMFVHYANAMNIAIFRCEVGGYTGVASIAGVANAGDCRRTFYTNSNGVVFSVGYTAPGNTTTINSGASNVAYNDAAIPIKIYGVKKVKVWKRTD